MFNATKVFFALLSLRVVVRHNVRDIFPVILQNLITMAGLNLVLSTDQDKENVEKFLKSDCTNAFRTGSEFIDGATIKLTSYETAYYHKDDGKRLDNAREQIVYQGTQNGSPITIKASDIIGGRKCVDEDGKRKFIYPNGTLTARVLEWRNQTPRLTVDEICKKVVAASINGLRVRVVPFIGLRNDGTTYNGLMPSFDII